MKGSVVSIVALAIVAVLQTGCGGSDGSASPSRLRIVSAPECPSTSARAEREASPRTTPAAPPSPVEEGAEFCLRAFADEGGEVTDRALWSAEPEGDSGGTAEVLTAGHFVAMRAGSVKVQAVLPGGRRGQESVQILTRLVPARLVLAPESSLPPPITPAPLPLPSVADVFPPPDDPERPLICPEGLAALDGDIDDSRHFQLPGDRMIACILAVDESGRVVELTDDEGQVYVDDLELVSDDPTIVTTVSPEDGLVAAESPGVTNVRARFRGVESNPVTLDVAAPVPPATLVIDTRKGARALSVGEHQDLTVIATYDGGQQRDATGDAYIESTSRRGQIDDHDSVLGLQAGSLTLRTELDGVEDTLDLVVWESFRDRACATGGRSRDEGDGFNFVRMETDCAVYRPGESAGVILDAHVILPPEVGATAPCLDLAVLDAAGARVRTMRDAQCASHALPTGPAGPYVASTHHSWDLTDDDGRAVAAGDYTLTFDLGPYAAITSLPVTVER